jgi:MFS-type transporter involved in bile tolerance (Atg22 family)
MVIAVNIHTQISMLFNQAYIPHVSPPETMQCTMYAFMDMVSIVMNIIITLVGMVLEVSFESGMLSSATKIPPTTTIGSTGDGMVYKLPR